MKIPARQGTYLRGSVWFLHIALPLIGLWILLAQPAVDAHLQHNPTHFWLVALVALINVAIANRISAEAARRADARLLLVSLAFQVSAAFIGLHALATPQVFLASGNVGFTLASPVGLFLASVIAAVSSLDIAAGAAQWIVVHQRALRSAVVAVVVFWAFLSLNRLPPLSGLAPEELAGTWLVWLAIVTVLLFVWSAYRYFQLYRQRPSAVTLALITAFVLLAESMVAVIFSRVWRLSWWEWHVLALAGFGYVGYAAYLQYRKEGRSAGLFDAVVLGETVARVREEYRDALERMVSAMSSTETSDRRNAAEQLGEELGLGGIQVDFLFQAAEAVATERRHGEMLAALVEVGRRTRVSGEDRTMVEGVVETIARASGYDIRVSLIRHHKWQPIAVRSTSTEPWPSPGTEEVAGVIRAPIEIKGDIAGVLEARGIDVIPPADRSLLESLAGQLSIALENQRLYRDLRGLFGRYTSPEVATALLSGATRLDLGGSVAEVTVLFADLQGFTSFSERVAHPEAVVDLLNRYLSAAVPVVRKEGGTVDKFVGDAMMALFNTPVLQADHALRAARAALGMQAAVSGLEEDLSFRIGINTGPVLVGNIGSEDLSNYTAIGDAVNVASRLETMAEPGEILVGPTTAALIRHVARLERLGEVEVKGRSEPVLAYRLVGLDEPGTL
jgi:class 3 adenylate cyclase